MRAHILPLTCVNIVILHAGSLTVGQKFFATRLNFYNFYQSVNFIERKCSLNSELSEFEGIIVIGDIYWILELSATD